MAKALTQEMVDSFFQAADALAAYLRANDVDIEYDGNAVYTWYINKGEDDEKEICAYSDMMEGAEFCGLSDDAVFVMHQHAKLMPKYNEYNRIKF